MAALTLTQKQFSLLMMAIEVAMKWAIRQIQDLSEAELDKLIDKEELRTEELMAQLDKTGK